MNNISLIYFFAGILGIALILLMLTRNPKKNLMPFIFLVLAASFYSVMYGVEVSMTDPGSILWILKFEYLAIAIIPSLWLIFVFSYTGADKKIPKVLYLLFYIVPVIVTITAFSGHFIPLLYEKALFISHSGLLLISIVPGPVYLMNMAYTITAFLAGVLILADFAGHTHGIIKNQVLILIFSGTSLIVIFITYLFWIGPRYHIDINPIAFLFTLFMGFLAIFQYRLFSLVPVAYGTIFQKIPSALVITDPYGYVIEANEVADILLNTNIRENPGEILTEYCSDCPEFNEFIDSILKNGLEEKEKEITCIRNSIKLFLEVRATPIKDRHGNSEGYIIAVRDITKQKIAEEEIKKSEKLFRSLFEQSPVAYLALDKDGNITGINPEFIKKTGYEWKEVFKKPLYSFISEKTSGEAEKTIISSFSKGEIYTELEFVTKKGDILITMLSGRIQYDAAGNFLRCHCILHDITERKRMEDSLHQVNTKLNLLSRITRHDILNQLTILKGYQGLSAGYLDESGCGDRTLQKYMEKEAFATENIYQQIKFTEDYQDIGVESPVWQNISETFTESIKNLNTGDVRIKAEPDTFEIYADPLLGKVFYNLVENSLNYGEDLTDITLSWKKTEDSLVILYTDNGKGIPENEKENIFTRKYFKNSGLGMFLSREILAITGITIKETGVYGEGVVFEITVPKGVFRT